MNPLYNAHHEQIQGDQGTCIYVYICRIQGYSVDTWLDNYFAINLGMSKKNRVSCSSPAVVFPTEVMGTIYIIKGVAKHIQICSTTG